MHTTHTHLDSCTQQILNVKQTFDKLISEHVPIKF